MTPSLELAPGFSMANARVCLAASARAYSDTPPQAGVAMIETELMRCRIEPPGGEATGQRAVIIAFRGTASVRDFVTDAEFWRNPLGGFEVHHGFRAAYASIIGLIEDWKGWSDGPAGPGLHLPIICTGHSLGGACAQLCAWALHVAGFPVHSVYTFGGPRVGDRDWAREYNSRLGERTWRCVNQVDVVPRLPGVLMGYRHCGHEAFMPAFGGVSIDPALWFKGLSDAVCLYWTWKSGRLALLPNHALAAYQGKLGIEQAEPRLGKTEAEPRLGKTECRCQEEPAFAVPPIKGTGAEPNVHGFEKQPAIA